MKKCMIAGAPPASGLADLSPPMVEAPHRFLDRASADAPAIDGEHRLPLVLRAFNLIGCRAHLLRRMPMGSGETHFPA